MVKNLCIIQARLNSSRLPAKMMLDLAGKTVLERVIESISNTSMLDKIVVATSTYKADDVIEAKLHALGIECYRGSLENVLERFYHCATHYKAKNIIRICADSPLLSAELIDTLLKSFEKSKYEWMGFLNTIYGIAPEVFSYNALKEAYHNARNNYDKEHVTPYMKDNVQSHFIEVDKKFRRSDLKAVIDTFDEYLVLAEYFIFCQNSKRNPYEIENYYLYLQNVEDSNAI